MLRYFLLSTFFVSVTYCMFNADPINWNRHPYLVKVLTRDLDSKNISTCSGTLISPSAVLTSAKCFSYPQENLEAQVIIPIQGTSNVLRRSMLDVKIDENTAVLRIDTVKQKTLCERPPHPNRFSHLNFKSSLIEVPFQPLRSKELEGLKCRLIGFETNEDVENFAKSPNVQLLELEVRPESESTVFSEVNGNSTGSACWDDVGAPLECVLNQDSFYTQVGFLKTIYSNEFNEEFDVMNATCTNVQAMEFQIFNNFSLATSIEFVDKIGVFEVLDKCF